MDYDFKFKKSDWLYVIAIAIGCVYIIVEVIRFSQWFK